MPRNAEVIRQWNILREIERQRQGATIAMLARLSHVTTRTIRRDLDALQQAGFPLFDDKVEGEVRWKLDVQVFKGLETGFTLSELSALYFSRALLESLTGAPFHHELASAFARIERALSPRMRQFLDRLPQVISARSEPSRKPHDPGHADLVARLVDATMNRRQAEMRYHSFSSGRTKDYLVDPYRLIYSQGGMYLSAYVNEYQEMRTFAIERIERLSVLDTRFDVIEGLAAEAMPHSLGMFHGPPESVSIEFAPRVAPYVKERVWHPSQSIRDEPDGSVVLTLSVAIDWSLRTFILGFGPLARVLSPSSLAEQILDDIDRARTQYIPRLEFELPGVSRSSR